MKVDWFRSILTENALDRATGAAPGGNRRTGERRPHESGFGIWTPGSVSAIGADGQIRPATPPPARQLPRTCRGGRVPRQTSEEHPASVVGRRRAWRSSLARGARSREARCPARCRCSHAPTGGTWTSARRRSIPGRPRSSPSSTTAARGGCTPTSAATSRLAASKPTACRSSPSTAPSRRRRCSSSTPTRATAWTTRPGRACPSTRSPTRPRPCPTGSRAARPETWINASQSDRHLIIVDRDNRRLYELYNVYFDGQAWHAGSGAFFDLTRNDRRPDGWTSADAAGLAILPGLVRYDEVYGAGDEIRTPSA